MYIHSLKKRKICVFLALFDLYFCRLIRCLCFKGWLYSGVFLRCEKSLSDHRRKKGRVKSHAHLVGVAVLLALAQHSIIILSFCLCFSTVAMRVKTFNPENFALVLAIYEHGAFKTLTFVGHLACRRQARRVWIRVAARPQCTVCQRSRFFWYGS